MYIHWAQLGVGGELPKSQDVRLVVTSAADLLRRANREGCALLLGARRVDGVGPSMAAVVAREGIAAVVVDLESIVDGAIVVVVIVVVSHFQEWAVVVVNPLYQFVRIP